MSEKIIDKIQYSKDNRLEVLQKIKQSQKPLFVYGAGKAAQLRIKWLKEYNVSIEGCCVDSCYYKRGMVLEQINVYCIDDLKQLYGEFDLFVGFEDHSKAKEVIDIWKQKEIDVYYIEDPFKFRYMDYNFFLKNSDKFQMAYDLLEDDLSRKIFIAHINSKISGCSNEIAGYQSDFLYNYEFDLLDLNEKEIFVDCGAFDGDTISEFVEYVENSYEKIIAFEPDKNNAEKLKRKIESDKVRVIESGTGAKKGTASFYADASLYSNFVDTCIWGEKTRRDLYEDANEYIEVPITSIDIELRGIPVSFIKMDIEGSELSALIGAQEIIKENHPKLAICVYHKQEDLFAIPNYIYSLETEAWHYKYYLRHHSDNLTETVLYAIPYRT